MDAISLKQYEIITDFNTRRLNLGITRLELSKDVGINTGILSIMESESVKVKVESVVKLHNFLLNMEDESLFPKITEDDLRSLFQFNKIRIGLQLSLREVSFSTGISRNALFEIENKSPGKRSFYNVIRLNNYYKSYQK